MDDLTHATFDVCVDGGWISPEDEDFTDITKALARAKQRAREYPDSVITILIVRS